MAKEVLEKRIFDRNVRRGLREHTDEAVRFIRFKVTH
jgi:hypothetical protein